MFQRAAEGPPVFFLHPNHLDTVAYRPGTKT
jgi:hypothetical protein